MRSEFQSPPKSIQCEQVRGGLEIDIFHKKPLVGSFVEVLLPSFFSDVCLFFFEKKKYIYICIYLPTLLQELVCSFTG